MGRRRENTEGTSSLNHGTPSIDTEFHFITTLCLWKEFHDKGYAVC